VNASPAFVVYYRVSTDRQGRSGLGLEAQCEAVARFLTGHPGAALLGEFRGHLTVSSELHGKAHARTPYLSAGF